LHNHFSKGKAELEAVLERKRKESDYFLLEAEALKVEAEALKIEALLHH
jgi:hypothetical protein